MPESTEEPSQPESEPEVEDILMEPCFILLATDAYAATAVLRWADRMEKAEHRPDVADAARAYALKMQQFGREHGTKVLTEIPEMEVPHEPPAKPVRRAVHG